jgi:GDP-L-fucose synthase
MHKMDFKGKTIIVTGGSGFLGRRIVQELEEKKVKVINPKQIDFDLTNLEDAKKLFSKYPCDMIIHSAALYGGLGINTRIPADIFDYNIRMLLNLFSASIENKKPLVEKFVSIGSACAYPDKWGANMKEEFLWEGPLDKSVRNYGTVKKLMETAGHVYRDQYGLHSIHLPLATMYGEHDTFNPDRSHVPAALIRRFVEAKLSESLSIELWGVPDTVREFAYVGDIAEGIVLATEKFEGMPEGGDETSRYTLNIGTGVGTTIDELARTIADIVGFQGKIKYNGKASGQKAKALNIDRIKNVLGWQPKHSLKEGLEKTINWYMKNKQEADARP